MSDWRERTEYVIGKEGKERLENARVLLFGVGGVGSYAAEALVRAGVGAVTFVDGDIVSETNLNRQLVALRSTVGEAKADVMVRRARDINPDITAEARAEMLTAENADSFDFSAYTYVADAIDDVKAKVIIAKKAQECGVPLISSMGTGGKTDPSMFRVCDIGKTEGDALARTMRRLLREAGVKKLNVVFSPEVSRRTEREGKSVFGTLSFVPGAAGLVMAGKIIRDIAEVENG